MPELSGVSFSQKGVRKTPEGEVAGLAHYCRRMFARPVCHGFRCTEARVFRRLFRKGSSSHFSVATNADI